MAYTDYFDEVQSVYIAYYRRPADPAGLRYWAQRLDDEGGNLDAIIDAFSTSPEAKTLYPEGTDLFTLVDSVYSALFGRRAENGNDNFYVKALAAGHFPDGRPATLGRVALDILNGARNEDRTAIDNKLAVANDFTQIIDGRPLSDADFGKGDKFAVSFYEGDTDAAAARNFLKEVTWDGAKVPDKNALHDFIMKYISDFSDDDTIYFVPSEWTDRLVGTAGDDVINIHSTYAADPNDLESIFRNPMNNSDSIDGGPGEDTLVIDIASEDGVFSSAYQPTTTGVEHFIVRRDPSLDSFGLVFADLDFSLAEGEKSVLVDNMSVSLYNLGTGTVVTFKGGGYPSSLNMENPTDPLTVILDGFNGYNSNPNYPAFIYNNIGKNTLYTLVTTGEPSVLGGLVISDSTVTNLVIRADADLTIADGVKGFRGEIGLHGEEGPPHSENSIVITGSANRVVLNTVSSVVDIIDASGFAGGVVVDASRQEDFIKDDGTITESPPTLSSFTGGHGDDTLYLGSAATVTGNGGNDTFVVDKAKGMDRIVTVTDAAAGDTLGTQGSGTIAGSSLGAATDIGGATDLVSILNILSSAALSNTATDSAWAVVGNDAYLVISDGYDAAINNENIVKLAGVTDLSKATVVDTEGTIVLA